ncbi:UbiX family flavin prenyltransferase [Nitrosophilus labii]|uniref:UbiX family flavin prenyltransferase n=1 Tax=Nitrosophilus labii TaxID=2706014 RepID=UPI001656D057|nr:UbiX family flavin prenyltransferase [Nitrosophilus labii]
MKIVVAISGASGVNLGLKTYDKIPKNHEKYLIVNENADIVSLKERGYNIFENKEIWEGPASGSFGVDAMMVVPCSMNTLAKIAVGISDNLTTRAASVIIKEKKKLLLSPRELPFSPIALENMHKLSLLNVIIAPPVLGYYSQQKSLEEMEDFIIGKWFDLLGIENSLYKRWGKNE